MKIDENFEKTKIQELAGSVLVKITGLEKNSESVIFETNYGHKFIMCHDQECCEEVSIEDVNGNIEDLLNTPILKAEERVGVIDYKEYQPRPMDSFYQVRSMYTFYTLATVKGYVDIRWYGESNGYYSVGVDLFSIK